MSKPSAATSNVCPNRERVRGRGVGRALKVANARLLMSLPESTGSRILQTYTDVDLVERYALLMWPGFTRAKGPKTHMAFRPPCGAYYAAVLLAPALPGA